MDAAELIEVFTENIKTLPIGVITLSTPEGPVQSDALLLGDWALNENSTGWTVTHRTSGYAGASYSTPIEALISLGVFIGAGLAIPEPFAPGMFSELPDIRNIAARIRAALTVLDAWDLDIDYNESESDP